MKWIVLAFVVFAAGSAWADPVEGVLTYYDQDIPGNYHVLIRNDRFGIRYEPQDFGVPDSLWIISGIWSRSGMYGTVKVALCEDDTTHPELDHFPGDTIRYVEYFDPVATLEDTVLFEEEVIRKDNQSVWVYYDYEVDGVPFFTSGTNPPDGRNLVRKVIQLRMRGVVLAESDFDSAVHPRP